MRGAEVPIEAARLAWGATEGEAGDVTASCSCGLIAEKTSRIHKPFLWRGAQWVCTGMEGTGAGGPFRASVYRVVPRAEFRGPVTTYYAKTRPDAARNDPMGFYHGVLVLGRGGEYVLCGPEVVLVPAAIGQLSLFGEVA